MFHQREIICKQMNKMDGIEHDAGMSRRSETDDQPSA
jgi:hypothetical protein